MEIILELVGAWLDVASSRPVGLEINLAIMCVTLCCQCWQSCNIGDFGFPPVQHWGANYDAIHFEFNTIV